MPGCKFTEHLYDDEPAPLDARLNEPMKPQATLLIITLTYELTQLPKQAYQKYSKIRTTSNPLQDLHPNHRCYTRQTPIKLVDNEAY